MNKEEQNFEIAERIGYKVGTYCNDKEIEVFEKFLEDYKYKSNLIEKQQAEIEKKDKIINLMAECMEKEGTGKRAFSCMFRQNEECNENGCRICIKQHFKRKIEQ